MTESRPAEEPAETPELFVQFLTDLDAHLDSIDDTEGAVLLGALLNGVPELQKELKTRRRDKVGAMRAVMSRAEVASLLDMQPVRVNGILSGASGYTPRTPEQKAEAARIRAANKQARADRYAALAQKYQQEAQAEEQSAG